MYWRKLTSKGALIGGSAGLITATILVILGPAVWVEVFGYDEPIFPYKYPALFSVTTAFVLTWVVSMLDNSKSSKRESAAFDSQFIKSHYPSLSSNPEYYKHMDIVSDFILELEGKEFRNGSNIEFFKLLKCCFDSIVSLSSIS